MIDRMKGNIEKRKDDIRTFTGSWPVVNWSLPNDGSKIRPGWYEIADLILMGQLDNLSLASKYGTILHYTPICYLDT